MFERYSARPQNRLSDGTIGSDEKMIDWQNPTYFDLPDLRMAVFEAGQKRTDIPSLVLCHGWPELAYSWRKVVPILVEAGLHVIVPEQRGFGMTGKALNDSGDESGVPLYDMTHLTGDLAHLLDAMDIEKAIFTGHDWGGFVIWQMPFFHPTRTAGLGRRQHALCTAPQR